MSRMSTLHSHSGLERELRFPKHTVLVDARFAYLFNEDTIKPFTYNKIDYFKVPVLSFIDKRGVFKNLMS